MEKTSIMNLEIKTTFSTTLVMSLVHTSDTFSRDGTK